jgi:DNA-binding beta-propeller fold protein YncE
MPTLRRLYFVVQSLLGGAILVTAGSGVAQAADYRLVKKIVLGGEGGWDYFKAEPVTHRVFIARGTHLMVLDPDGKVVEDVTGIKGSHAVDFAPDLKRIFTSNGSAGSVSMLEQDTLRVIAEVKIPDRDPDAILYEPVSKRIFTFNGEGGNDATAIDAKTGEVLGNIPLGGKPEFAQTDGAGRVFVNIEDQSQIKEIDPKGLKVRNTWPMGTCKEPSGMAIDVAHKRIFSGCHNGITVVVDYSTGKVVTAFPIGQGVDANQFDPGAALVFASCGDGTITVAHQDSPDKYTVVQTIATQAGARTMALDTANHNIYTVTAERGPAPPATKDNPRPRPSLVPGTFTLLIFSQLGK